MIFRYEDNRKYSIELAINKHETIAVLRRHQDPALPHSVAAVAAPNSNRGIFCWNGIAETGNICRHNYERVFDKAVWTTVRESLGPLLAVVEVELRRLEAE